MTQAIHHLTWVPLSSKDEKRRERNKMSNCTGILSEKELIHHESHIFYFLFFILFLNLVYCAKIEVHVTHTNRCLVLKQNGELTVTVLNLAGTLAFSLHQQGLIMSRGVSDICTRQGA